MSSHMYVAQCSWNESMDQPRSQSHDGVFEGHSLNTIVGEVEYTTGVVIINGSCKHWYFVEERKEQRALKWVTLIRR